MKEEDEEGEGVKIMPTWAGLIQCDNHVHKYFRHGNYQLQVNKQCSEFFKIKLRFKLEIRIQADLFHLKFMSTKPKYHFWVCFFFLIPRLNFQ